MLDFQSYKDNLGFIHLGKNPTGPSDNAVLYTAQSYMLDFINKTSCFDKDDLAGLFKKAEVLPGLHDKYPSLKKMNSHDNQIGMLASLRVLSEGWSNTKQYESMKNIYLYGEDNGYNYNNIMPAVKEPTSLRQGYVIAFIKMCVGREPSIWFKAWFILAILLSVIKNLINDTRYTSSIILSKMMLIALSWDRNWNVLHGFFNIFVNMSKIADIYYPKGHPIIEQWKKYEKEIRKTK